MTGNLIWMKSVKSIYNTILVIIVDSIATIKSNVQLLASNWKMVSYHCKTSIVSDLEFNLLSLTTLLDKGCTQQTDVKMSKIL